MSLFKKYLQDSESLFKNETALDPNFTPRGPIEFRENENHYIAEGIKPLFQKRPGKNLIISGPSGIGKTLACLKIKEELEATTDDILIFYINLWKKNTQHKIILELCEQLNYKFTLNKSTDELFNIIRQKINPKAAVFILDEADKAESLEILYNLLEDIYRKTLLLITNEKDWIYKLDPRLKSRLIPDHLEFKPYAPKEISTILKNRTELAFHSNTLSPEALSLIIQKTSELTDIRIGLFLLRESGLMAESSSLKQINSDHVKSALSKLKDFQKPLSLDAEETSLLKIIQINPSKTVQDLFQLYQAEFGNKSFRTFQRKLNTLETAHLIERKEISGLQGKSHLIQINNKKLSDF